ncbi:MAG: ArgE/DapE family deacylase [Peptoniphilaceae bacterium]|nr:ArgE/DapE family deacylase [Peptoniphilaceae bacterium]MDY6085500.1 ArgE/DapE family deacylase [Peptoniphilaceae bacterium]
MNREERIQIFQDFIRIKTENDNERELALYIQKLLEAHDIASKLVTFREGRDSLIAEIQNGEGKTLAISGHMDVVDAGDPSAWTHDPYAADIEDDILWGRGASDMKSGLAALVIAFIETKERGNFKGTIRLIATVGEEVGELGAGQLTKEGYMEGVDGLLIGEPCNLGVVYAHKGSLNYKVISKGMAAHSSAPEIGVNAVENLSAAVTAIKKRAAEWKEAVHSDIFGQMDHSITVIKGGTQVNSIPDYAEFQANVRTIPEKPNAEILKEIQEILDELNAQKGFDLTLEVTADQPPIQSHKDSALIQTVVDVVSGIPSLAPKAVVASMAEAMGIRADAKDLDPMTVKVSKDKIDALLTFRPIAIPGTTDAAQFLRENADEVDFAVYGPGMPMLNHKIDERMPLAQYLDFIEAYNQIFDAYLS